MAEQKLKLGWPDFVRCERCGKWIPLEEAIMVSAWESEPKIACLDCLLYLLGELYGIKAKRLKGNVGI